MNNENELLAGGASPFFTLSLLSANMKTHNHGQLHDSISRVLVRFTVVFAGLLTVPSLNEAHFSSFYIFKILLAFNPPDFNIPVEAKQLFQLTNDSG